MKKCAVLVLISSVTLSFFSCREDTVNPPVDPISPTQIFSKTIGSNLSDLVTGVKQSDDGGVVLCGFTIASAFGDNDIFIMKLDAGGNVLWSNLYGGAGNDQATCLEKTADGGFIISGHTSSFVDGFNPLTIKIDGNGNVQWSKYYRWGGEDYSTCIAATSDGGYIMTGFSNSFGSGGNDIYSLKLDQSGSIMWMGCYGGQFDEFGSAIRQTGTGYIIGGYTFSFGTAGDAYILKLYGDGVTEWSKIYGSAGFDNIKDLQVTSNGYVACGSTGSFGLTAEASYVFNIDNSGFVYWSRTFQGNAPGPSQFTRVIQTSEGGFALAGFMLNTAQNGADMSLVKLYGDGAFNYEKIFGGVGTDIALALSVKSDGGYLLTGATASFGAGANDIYLQSLRNVGTGCMTDNPVTPIGGNPTTEVNTPNTVYMNVNYETVVVQLNSASFNTISNTQCIVAP